jgi:serine/threonine-protein kinase RsbW
VTDEWPIVRLELDSRPETLTLVRSALSGIADPLALDPELLDDLKTAVSEACNNVVMHAYDGAPGPLQLCLYADSDAIEVVVRDHGGGIPEIASSDDRLQGVGLPIIQALTAHAEFRPLPRGGTEVRMTFVGERDGKLLFRQPAKAAPDNALVDRLAGDAIASISPVTFLGGLLGRLARALAARARFSLDRFSDFYLVTDALDAHAGRAASAGRIGFGISTSVRRLELTIGPFREGSSETLAQEHGVGHDLASALVSLSDKLEVQPGDGGEFLHVALLDPRPGSGEQA